MGLLLLTTVALAEPEFPVINSSTPLSLDSLIALGFRYSPVLRQTTLTTRLNTIGKINAVGQFLPTVSLGLSFSQTHYRSPTFVNPNGSVGVINARPAEVFRTYVVNWDTSGGVPHNPQLAFLNDTIPAVTVPEGDSRSSSMFISLNESLFEGGRRFFLYRLAKVQEKINNESVDNVKKNLAAQIAEQVMVVLTQERLVDLDKRLRDQRKDALDLARARFEVGAVTELDVMQAEIDLNTAENDLSTAGRTLESDREALNQIIGINLNSTYPLEEGIGVTPYQFNVDSLVNVAYGSRSDLRIARLTVQRATQNVNMNYSNYLPTASVGAQFGRSENSGKNVPFTLNPRNISNRYSLNLNWNIFDGFTREYNLESARVSRAQAVEGEKQLQLSVVKAVHDSYFNLVNTFGQLQLTGRNRDLAERRLNLERERYRLGAASQLDLRDAEVTYAQAETSNLQTTLAYQSSLIALELAVGKPLR
jgi:outer membrane protein TolC